MIKQIKGTKQIKQQKIINDNISIEISDLSKYYKNNQVLKNLNMKVSKGTFHALIGENGAGKTTLLKSVLSLFADFAGTIKINNISNLLPESRNGIFYLPANLIYPRGISTYHFLFNYYSLIEKNRNKIKSDILQNLKELNIIKYKNNNVSALSSGQLKKVYMVLIKLFDPEILILDEPSTNLDPNTRKQLYKMLMKYKDMGRTILISTHNLAEISAYVDEASFIYNGIVFWNGKISTKVELEKTYFKLLDQQMIAIERSVDGKA